MPKCLSFFLPPWYQSLTSGLPNMMPVGGMVPTNTLPGEHWVFQKVTCTIVRQHLLLAALIWLKGFPMATIAAAFTGGAGGRGSGTQAFLSVFFHSPSVFPSFYSPESMPPCRLSFISFYSPVFLCLLWQPFYVPVPPVAAILEWCSLPPLSIPNVFAGWTGLAIHWSDCLSD